MEHPCSIRVGQGWSPRGRTPYTWVVPAYRLQTLLGIRERKEEEAKQAFAEAMQAVFKAQEEQKRLEADLLQRQQSRKQKIADYMKEILAKGTGAGGISAMNTFENRLKDEEALVALQIEKQKGVVKAAEKVREQRRLDMAEAAKDKKAIEKHKEHWAKDVKHQRDQREELTQEEIGSALHLARTRKSS